VALKTWAWSLISVGGVEPRSYYKKLSKNGIFVFRPASQPGQPLAGLLSITSVALTKPGLQQFLFIAGKVIIADADSNPENRRK
jgi:hypothetical protein